MTKTASRRSLEFNDFAEVVADIESLHANGYDQLGDWNLGQVCGHAADWMRFPMEGFPRPAFPTRMMLAALKVTVGKRMIRKVLDTKEMPEGNPTLPETVHESAENEQESVEALCEAIRQFEKSDGPFHASPLFGELTRDELIQLHLIHCAHHLSFLVPKNA